VVFLKPVNKKENKDGIGVALKTDILYEVAFGNLAGGGSLRQTTVVWSAVDDELDGVYENHPFVAVSPKLVQKRRGLGSRARSQNVLLPQLASSSRISQGPRRKTFYWLQNS
jgi:hypothetical protein